VACRLLTPNELQRLFDVFAQVTIWTTADGFCANGVEDPCLVKVARWDSLQSSDALCASSRLDREQSGSITAVIESLGSGPETACDEGFARSDSPSSNHVRESARPRATASLSSVRRTGGSSRVR
jgi:hypothetical protein